MEQGAAITASGTAERRPLGGGWHRIPVVSLRRNLNATQQGLRLLDQNGAREHRTEQSETGWSRRGRRQDQGSSGTVMGQGGVHALEPGGRGGAC